MTATDFIGYKCLSMAIRKVAGWSPPTYRGFWNVTKAKGRWSIQVETPHRSNSVNFKVDKREQIVQVAQSWIGASAAQLGSQMPNCNDLTAKVYGHLGLGQLPIDSTDAQYRAAPLTCVGDGCLLFYSRPNADQGDVAHVGIKSGNERININSNTTPGEPVVPEDIRAGVLSGAPLPYKDPIESRSTINLDED